MSESDRGDTTITRLEGAGALSILRQGIAATPALKRGLYATVFMGVGVALGRLAIPVLIQQALDDGRLTPGAVDFGVIYAICAIAVAVIVASAVVSALAQRRLVDRAEESIASLRVQGFTKVHQLSVADHNESQRGVLVARVTSDVEALAKFATWGLYAWAINPLYVVGILTVMAVYSWQIALLVLLLFVPALPVMRWIQRRQLAANDLYRDAVGDMMGTFSETVSGAPVIRAYGAEGRSREHLDHSIGERYRTRVYANRFTAGVFVVSDIFAALAFGVVLVVGVVLRDHLGIDGGELVALLFLVTLLAAPISEISETLDQTQSAVASWRKILLLIAQPIDVPEPVPGVEAPTGPVAVEVDHVTFAYRDADPVLHDVSLTIPARTAVAVVGETGSGKSTMAKLLCRLADPSSGEIRLNGAVLSELAESSRLATVRMVPQDGFLFDTTVLENIRYGRPDASDGEIREAVTLLGLDRWVGRLQNGLETRVGERGESLSVGERQLVALVRAALADPGLLILDEATSAVDPETDAALTAAIRRLAEGRTLISIAHRLATAEASDLIVVFDAGRIVEVGAHEELVGAGGVYANLHRAWSGAVLS